MTKEKLLEWGLTEEQATKVMEGLNGSFVTKARFNEVNTEPVSYTHLAGVVTSGIENPACSRKPST